VGDAASLARSVRASACTNASAHRWGRDAHRELLQGDRRCCRLSARCSRGRSRRLCSSSWHLLSRCLCLCG
jgi:hypothetical protein